MSNDLALDNQQAIVLTTDSQGLWCQMALLGHKELRDFFQHLT